MTAALRLKGVAVRQQDWGAPGQTPDELVAFMPYFLLSLNAQLAAMASQIDELRTLVYETGAAGQVLTQQATGGPEYQ